MRLPTGARFRKKLAFECLARPEASEAAPSSSASLSTCSTSKLRQRSFPKGAPSRSGWVTERPLVFPCCARGWRVGTIHLRRAEVRPFTDKQIELVKNFASQAVIAIENTRLFKELRQRTADLSKSLERQTATSNVLSVISSSPGNLEPVFEAMLTNAMRICEAKFGHLLLYDGEAFQGA